MSQIMTPPSNPPPLDLSESFGPILIGVTLSWAAWGVSCLQLFLYYTSYENDSTGLKIFVLLVWLTDTVTQVVITVFMWQILILKWAAVPVLQPLALHRIWLGSIVLIAVQVFFLGRIYRLGRGSRWKRMILPILLGPVILWQLVGLIPYLIITYQNPSFATLSTHRIIALEISLRSCSAFIDIVIASVMIYLLYTGMRLHSDLIKSKKMVHRLIVLTAVTGSWTAVVALIDLILMTAFPQTLRYAYVEYSLSPLYVNALLANLNARQYLRKADVVQISTFPERDGNTLALHDVSSLKSTTSKGASTTAMLVNDSRIVDTEYSADSQAAKSMGAQSNV